MMMIPPCQERLSLFLLLLLCPLGLGGEARRNRDDRFFSNDDYYSGRRFSKSSLLNSTTSFISRGPDGLALESRHRVFSIPDLRRMWRSAGCNADEIALVCHDANQTIVIENASFYAMPEQAIDCSRGPIGPLSPLDFDRGTDPLRSSFFPELLGMPRLSRDLRQALNRRCSGMGNARECTFNLALDHPESSTWGTGLTDIFYRCAPNEHTNRYCSPATSLPISTYTADGSTQFLMSPVYPKYYVGGRTCHWLLEAQPGQRIQLRFLDVSLRERVSSSDPECTDAVSVSEKTKTLMRMCGESNEDIVLLSKGNTLEVKLDLRTKTVFPKRGLLAEFWPLGCGDQPPPGDGFLQSRNDTHAVYACAAGHVFLPDIDKIKTVRCGPDGTWDRTVGNCFSYEFLRKYGNASVLAILKTKFGVSGADSPAAFNPQLHSSQTVYASSGRSTSFSDIVLPVIIVGIVVILSLFAMIVLLLIRRHLQFEHEGHHVDEDRSALTPASVRRLSPVLQLEIGHSHLDPMQPRREELFLC